VAAVEILLLGEHVHRAALALGKAAAASGQLRHHAARAHAASQHVAVVAITGDDLVTLLQRHLHADNDSFLADIKVTEAADEAHAVKLAGLLLETPDLQHFAIGLQVVFLGEFGDGAAVEVFFNRLSRRLAAGRGRGFTRSHAFLPMFAS
jgi:hypothetical protein